MDLLRTAVVDITTMVATCHALKAAPEEAGPGLKRKHRDRLRRDVKHGTFAYIEALPRSRHGVVDEAYEATVCAAVLNARRGASNVVMLTRLGGGVFGRDDGWIDSVMRRALTQAARYGLDVRLVSHGAPPKSTVELARKFRSAS